jgi:hypothetical protein
LKKGKVIRYLVEVSTPKQGENLMTMKKVYQLFKEIRQWLPLKKWQAMGLALFSIGVVVSERSTLSKVAEKLWFAGRVDSLERRFQRWIANPRIDVKVCCQAWVRWVFSSMVDLEEVMLLVDLTKLSDRLDILMVGVAYRKRCIPLAWACLPGNQPWAEGQVSIIADLLTVVAAGLPAGIIPVVQADRGIGNSSNLMAVVEDMGWHFLFRVKQNSNLQLANGQRVELGTLVQPGKSWSGYGILFPTRRSTPLYVHLIWQRSMPEAWCLATNAPILDARRYALRMWQEEGFRDLKSGGWNWQRSQVRSLSHANRLVFVLVLAYAWTLSLGTIAIRAGKALRRKLARGRRRRLSVFRLGLRYLYYLFSRKQPFPFALFFRPALL